MRQERTESSFTYTSLKGVIFQCHRGAVTPVCIFCDHVTRLDFMAKFTYFKVKGKLTDSIIQECLEWLQYALPESKGYKFPPSYYAIKKTFKTIGLGYESIHACEHDCCLFRGEVNKDLQFCPVCNTSRWKDSDTPGKKVPRKESVTEPGLTACGTVDIGQPTSASVAKDIDVYLRPLIEDLQVLWDKKGVHVNSMADTDPEILLKNILGMGVKIKRNVEVELNWTKRSIFYELEYWSFISLRHNLDIMHIEKNVLEAILNTLLMNDNPRTRKQDRRLAKLAGIHRPLWLTKNHKGKIVKPQAAYSFTPENRKKFCQYIKGVKLPDVRIMLQAQSDR
ncbi:hypothetical protein Tco_1285166 [Tanacetum coccineum]